MVFSTANSIAVDVNTNTKPRFTVTDCTVPMSIEKREIREARAPRQS